MAPILQGGLSKAGICRQMARALVHGPKQYKGLNLHNLYTTQGLVQIQAILNHYWRGSDTGTLIKTSMEYIKMEVGMTGSLFQSDFNLFGHLAEDSLVKHVWEFMTEKGIEVRDDVGEFELLKEKDAPITLYFCNVFNHGLITAGEWKRANLCRKYLRVVTTAEIATGDGKYVTNAAMQGNRKATPTRQLPWFEQGKPNTKDWNTWRKVLTKSLCGDDRKLWISLGRWKHKAKQSIQETWDWLWDETDKVLYQRRGETWRRYQLSIRRRQLRSSVAFQYYTVVTQPAGWKRFKLTTVRHKSRLIYMEGFTSTTAEEEENTNYEPTIAGLRQ